MTTFAKSTFSAASYAAFRPTYPSSLYNAVLAYHRGPKRLCIDLGCGPGTATIEMARSFDCVIGTDPSPGMIKQASEQAAAENISYRQAPAESLPFVADEVVDCVIAAQSSHWFEYARLWPEMQRILRPGGTLAFWGYKDPALVDYPQATEILNKNTYGVDPETMGPYWSQPGRSYVQNLLRVVRPPEASFEAHQRLEYEPKCHGRGSGDGSVLMEKSLTLKELKEYYRTWSSFHGWQEKHPDEVARNKGGTGDLMDRVVDEIAEAHEDFKDEETMVDMEWGSAVVMCRRR